MLAKTWAMLLSPCGWTHPPPPVLPFPESSSMKLKFSCCQMATSVLACMRIQFTLVPTLSLPCTHIMQVMCTWNMCLLEDDCQLAPAWIDLCTPTWPQAITCQCFQWCMIPAHCPYPLLSPFVFVHTHSSNTSFPQLFPLSPLSPSLQ